jgi:hypothetical protein
MSHHIAHGEKDYNDLQYSHTDGVSTESYTLTAKVQAQYPLIGL